MAEYYLVLALTFSLFFHSISSRTYSASSTTTLFDVSDSIAETLEVLSMEPTEQHVQESKTKTETTSSFSISLHARSSLVKHHHKDYQSLILSRLERDSVRVNSLNTRLKFAVSGVNLSSLKPVETAAILPEDISSPITSVTAQGSGEYFTRIGVGQPANSYYMVLDTGSDVTWLQCQPCTDCYQQSDPIYDPSGSSTYSPLSCNSRQCSLLETSACRTNECLYQVAYGDGSFTVGNLVTETVSVGNSAPIPNVAIGCGHDNEGLFVGAAGLLGLGRGSLSFPSQIKANSFSYCLVNRGSSSSSTLDFNSGLPQNSVTAPLLRNSRVDTFMYVGLSGISVGGRMLNIPPSIFAVDESSGGGVIVDCGTAITRLQSNAYTSLRDAFVAGAHNLPSSSGFALFDTCFDLSSMSTVEVPTIKFHFTGDTTLPLPAKNYLIPVDSAGKFCLAFAPTQNKLSIIGNVQQQGIRVSFDLANSAVGFSPASC